MSSLVSTVYRYVVDDVLKNIKTELLNEGYDESVVHELQALWEQKLMQSGSIPGTAYADPEHFNQVYTGNYEHTTGASHLYHHPIGGSDHLYPTMDGGVYPASVLPTSMTTSTTTSSAVPPGGHQGHAGHVMSAHLAGHQDGYGGALPPIASFPAQFEYGKPQPFLTPASWTQAPSGPLSVNLTNPALQTVRRDKLPEKPKQNVNVPQYDGLDDGDQNHQADPENKNEPSTKWKEAKEVDDLIEEKLAGESEIEFIIQVDGGGDEDEKKKKGSRKKRAKKENKEEEEEEDEAGLEGEDESEEPLGSDLDDDDQQPTDTETDHLVLCLYEKVARIKNKRKCSLKDGIMHLNGKDYLFHKANGEFDW